MMSLLQPRLSSFSSHATVGVALPISLDQQQPWLPNSTICLKCPSQPLPWCMSVLKTQLSHLLVIL